jgi:hypothetical protein
MISITAIRSVATLIANKKNPLLTTTADQTTKKTGTKLLYVTGGHRHTGCQAPATAATIRTNIFNQLARQVCTIVASGTIAAAINEIRCEKCFK